MEDGGARNDGVYKTIFADLLYQACHAPVLCPADICRIIKHKKQLFLSIEERTEKCCALQHKSAYGENWF